MLIWVLALVLFLLFGALGYAKGAIRMVLPLAGLFLGVALAVPLAPLVKPLVPLVGLKNPIWSWLLPPVLVFFAIAVVFIIVGFIVHRKVYLFFKYGTDDYQRLSWERLNKRIGACMGLVAGASYTIILGLVIYIIGYLTVQVSAGENDAAIVRYLNKARADLRESGLEKTVAAFDPTPANYYLGSDLIGLLYHNPLLYTRLAGYPPFLALAERPEFQDVANDAEFQNLLQTQPAVGQIVNHPKTQAILNNEEILQHVEQTDLKDLREYLQTGESPKYGDTRILGRWQLDPYATLLQLKKRKTGITTAEMRLLKQQLEFIKSYSLVVSPDNAVRLKGPDLMPLLEKYLGELARAFAEGMKKSVPAPRAAVPALLPNVLCFATAPELRALPALKDVALPQRLGSVGPPGVIVTRSGLVFGGGNDMALSPRALLRLGEIDDITEHPRPYPRGRAMAAENAEAVRELDDTLLKRIRQADVALQEVVLEHLRPLQFHFEVGGTRKRHRHLVRRAHVLEQMAGRKHARKGPQIRITRLALLDRLGVRRLERPRTEIVLLALQAGAGDGEAQGLEQRRKVALEELILKGSGAGRDHDPPVRFARLQRRRKQVGQRLPHAGRRLGEQHAAVGQGLRHVPRHLPLSGPVLVAGPTRRQPAPRGHQGLDTFRQRQCFRLPSGIRGSERGHEPQVDLSVQRGAARLEAVVYTDGAAGGIEAQPEAETVAVEPFATLTAALGGQARVHERVVPEQEHALAAHAQEPVPLEPRERVAVDAERLLVVTAQAGRTPDRVAVEHGQDALGAEPRGP